MLRLRQRAGIDGYESLKTGLALFVVYSHVYLAARHTVMKIDEALEERTTHCYLLLQNHVIIGTHHIKEGLIILNTVINRDKFTEKQKAQYEPAYRYFIEKEGAKAGFYNRKYDLHITVDESFLSYKNITQLAEKLFVLTEQGD